MDPAHPSTRPLPPTSVRDLGLPRNAGKIGMALFLAALGMLFAASLVGYVVIRALNLQSKIDPTTGDALAPTGPPLGSLELPWPLWVSTLFILLSSMTIHMAVEAVRHERQKQLRSMLVTTLMLSGVFLLIQTPALGMLLAERYEAEGGFTAVYSLMFVLIVIHALHVLGGIGPLIYITHQAHRGRYDHEAHSPVTCVAMYWHFLDVVWLIMFATLLIAS